MEGPGGKLGGRCVVVWSQMSASRSVPGQSISERVFRLEEEIILGAHLGRILVVKLQFR